MTRDDGPGPRWTPARVTVAALSALSVASGVQLLSAEPNGRAGSGIALVVLGAVLAGAAALRE